MKSASQIITNKFRCIIWKVNESVPNYSKLNIYGNKRNAKNRQAKRCGDRKCFHFVRFLPDISTVTHNFEQGTCKMVAVDSGGWRRELK